MRPQRGRFSAAMVSSVILVVSLVLAGCGPGTGSGPTAAGSPATTPGPSAAALNLAVEPASFSGKSIRGSKVLFLVTVGGNPADGPAAIRITSEEGLAWADPVALLPDVVGEAWVWPGTKCPCTTVETPRQVRITASRNGVEQTETRTLTVTDETKETPTELTDSEHLDAFVTWFAKNRPDLRITDSSGWQGTLGSWVAGVEHWVYLSREWELDLSWSTGATAPNDWARISLRHRWSERAPSIAFQIDSVSSKDDPHEIQPPAAVWR